MQDMTRQNPLNHVQPAAAAATASVQVGFQDIRIVAARALLRQIAHHLNVTVFSCFVYNNGRVHIARKPTSKRLAVLVQKAKDVHLPVPVGLTIF